MAKGKEERYRENFGGADDGLGEAPSEQKQDATDTTDDEDSPITPPTDGQPTVSLDELPLIYRRDSVKENRDDAITIGLRPKNREKVKQLRRAMEDEFGDDDVQKMDVYEAIIEAVDIDQCEEVMRSYGYGLE